MSRLDEHPTVVRYREGRLAVEEQTAIDVEWLRGVCLEAGADDVGFVSLDRAELDDQRAEIKAAFPWATALVSIVCRMNREPVRSPARSVSNLEFHHTGDHTDEVARAVVRALERRGIRAANPSMGFPMETNRWPGKGWIVSHKPVAVAAGLGRIGIHRNVIHPRFGNFLLLATVVVGAPISEESRPIDYNPCLSCKLCVAACPVGAIGSDGHFDFSACYTHNYREFMGGFGDWVENVVESKDAIDYRRRVSDAETVSTWQSLSFGPNYKAAYCLAVCPAGEEVIGPFLASRGQFLEEVVEPLRSKPETLYVVEGSDAQGYASKRFPHKTLKPVHSGLRPNSVEGFLSAMPIVFQRGQSDGLSARYHFLFHGSENDEATVVIRDKGISVERGLQGVADLTVRADASTWIGFLRKEKSLVWALIRGKIRLKGSPKWLVAFGKCFPS